MPRNPNSAACSLLVGVLLASSAQAGSVRVTSTDTETTATVDPTSKTLRILPYMTYPAPQTMSRVPLDMRFRPNLFTDPTVPQVRLPVPFTLYSIDTSGPVAEGSRSFTYNEDYKNITSSLYARPVRWPGRHVALVSACIAVRSTTADVRGAVLRIRVGRPDSVATPVPFHALLVALGVGSDTTAGMVNTTSTPDLNGGGENSGNCVKLDDGNMQDGAGGPNGAVVIGPDRSVTATMIGNGNTGATFTIQGYMY